MSTMNTSTAYDLDDFEYTEDQEALFEDSWEGFQDDEYWRLSPDNGNSISIKPGTLMLGMCIASVILILILFKYSILVSNPVFIERSDEFIQNFGEDKSALTDKKPEVSRGPSITCGISDQYPQNIYKWCTTITSYAEKRGIPPDLIAAIIWQESGGNPNAYSRSGAVGLMQVMPRDGLAASFICINGPCFCNRPTIRELKDPEYNIAYGTKLLFSLINKNGSYREALKSYGPMDIGYSYADKVLNIYQNYGKKSQ